MSTNKILLFFIFTILLQITACRAPKDVIYLNDVNNSSETENIIESYETHQRYTSYIQPDDILSIMVNNSSSPEAAAQFNLVAPNNQKSQPTTSLQSFLVDNNGCINFPVLGRIKLSGLSKQEAIKYLEAEIGKVINNPIVSIQFVNYKISVLGEVVKPGGFTLPNERISILDAISLAGDLTINGQRTNVLVIRDNNGTIETHRLDLTSSEVFGSPYYYLRQNDIVYVTPNKARQKNANYSQANQMNITVVSTILTAISVIANTINIILLNKD